MNKQTFRILVGLFIALAIRPAHAQKIVQDKSRITFEVSNMKWNTVEGTLPQMEGSVQFDPENPSAGRFIVRVPTEPINTGLQMRDKHLHKEAFFHTEAYPYLRFRSSKITKNPAGYETKGKLTIRESSKSITIPFTVSRKNGMIVLEGITQINRKDFNIGADYGSFTIGNQVKIEIRCVLQP